MDAETLLESLSNSFYQEMIHELVAEQERKEGQIKDMKNSYQEQIRNLEEKQKAEVAGLEESHLLKVFKEYECYWRPSKRYINRHVLSTGPAISVDPRRTDPRLIEGL